MEVQSSERPSGHDGDLTAPHGVTSSPAGKLNFSRDTQAKGQGISVVDGPESSEWVGWRVGTFLSRSLWGHTLNPVMGVIREMRNPWKDRQFGAA